MLHSDFLLPNSSSARSEVRDGTGEKLLHAVFPASQRIAVFQSEMSIQRLHIILSYPRSETD